MKLPRSTFIFVTDLGF